MACAAQDTEARPRRPVVVWTIAVALLCLAALGGAPGCSKGGEASPDPQGRVRVRVQLNWVPEPEFGGLYAAELNGFFAEEGLSVEIVRGSAGVPAPQLTASGQVEFGVVGGDQVVALRAQGAPLVALFATFQIDPRAIAVHAASPYASLEALWRSDARLALEPGLPFARWLAHTYGARTGPVVPSTGGLAGFMADATLAQAVYAFAEPAELARRGVAVRTFNVADTGFNPYSAVVATSDRYLSEHPQVVAGFVRALRRGWAAYLADPGPTHRVMAPLNPAMSAEAMDASVALARPFVLGVAPGAGGAGPLTPAQVAALGQMSQARWQALVDQLVQVGAVAPGKAPAAETLFKELP